MYCDMETDDGGWTLVGVALVAYAGETGWNDDDGLNLALSYRQVQTILRAPAAVSHHRANHVGHSVNELTVVTVLTFVINKLLL